MSGGPIEASHGCEERKESGNMRNVPLPFKKQLIHRASDLEQLFRAAIKAALNVCGRASLSGLTLLDIQLASRTSQSCLFGFNLQEYGL